MTINELSQLYYLSREIGLDKKRLNDLKASAYSVKSPSCSNTPKTSAVHSAVEQNAISIAELEMHINSKISRCIEERARLEKYIAGIPDSLTRQIFTLRFINGLPWYQVAMHIGGNTEDSVRKIVYRYIDKQEKEAIKNKTNM